MTFFVAFFYGYLYKRQTGSVTEWLSWYKGKEGKARCSETVLKNVDTSLE